MFYKSCKSVTNEILALFWLKLLELQQKDNQLVEIFDVADLCAISISELKNKNLSISFGNPREFKYICRHLTKKRSKGALLCLSQFEGRITWLPQRERQLQEQQRHR